MGQEGEVCNFRRACERFQHAPFAPPPQLQDVSGAPCMQAYTDGSVLHPAIPPWALAGASLWHEGEAASIDAAFDDFMWRGEHGEGHAGWTYVMGPAPSSSRAQAVAIGIAMALQRRLLLWSDTSNVCRTVAAMTRGPSFLHSKPWGLRPNGDVWERLQRTHVERGPSNTCVLKTKGHATQQHIAERGCFCAQYAWQFHG
eukprot:14140552-Alexandrium_andersonii.AAC.1